MKYEGETLGFGKYANKAIHNLPRKYVLYLYYNADGKVKEKMKSILDSWGENPESRCIPIDKLPSHIGKPLHLKWAGGGRVWILQKIEGSRLHLITPKTRKTLIANAADALYCNKHLTTPAHSG